MHFYDSPKKCIKMLILIICGPLWAWQNLLGYDRKVHAKFWFQGTPWDPSYDYFWVPCCHPKCKSLLMKFSYLGRMAISRAVFWYLIIELVTRNPTMGISALEDGRFFANLLIFDYLYIIYLCFCCQRRR